MGLIIIVSVIVLVLAIFIVWNFTDFTIKFPKGCIGDGQKAYMMNNDSCCKGLTDIGNSQPYINEDGSVDCIATLDGSFYCTKCGNGVCGEGENECNCKEDCK